MSALIELSGRTFGRWSVVSKGQPPAGNKKTGSSWWRCRCKCGIERDIDSHSLRRGISTSCGCARTKHGASGTPEFNSYNAMCQRVKDADGYAGGVKIAARWLGPNGFKNFLKDMGPRPPGTSLDRRNRKKGYSKANCRWATRRQQTENRGVSRMVTLDGEAMTLGRAMAAMKEALRDGASFIIQTAHPAGDSAPPT